MSSLLDNWGDERGCDEGHWHAHAGGLPWGVPEVVGTVQQVNCSRGRLLRKGLEFHVCTINKSAIQKKSGNLSFSPRNIHLCVFWPNRLCKERILPQRVFWYDTKQSGGESQVLLQVWGMRSTSLLPSLPDPLWPGMLVSDRALSMDQIELFDIKTLYLC